MGLALILAITSITCVHAVRFHVSAKNCPGMWVVLLGLKDSGSLLEGEFADNANELAWSFFLCGWECNHGLVDGRCRLVIAIGDHGNNVSSKSENNYGRIHQCNVNVASCVPWCTCMFPNTNTKSPNAARVDAERRVSDPPTPPRRANTEELLPVHERALRLGIGPAGNKYFWQPDGLEPLRRQLNNDVTNVRWGNQHDPVLGFRLEPSEPVGLS